MTKSPANLSEFYALLQDKLGVPYANELGRVDRDRTMPWIFRELEKRFPDGARIVETGCIRSEDDWSAGYSTWLFHEWLKLTNRPRGWLASIDNDAARIEIATDLCGWPKDRPRGPDVYGIPSDWKVSFVWACSAESLSYFANRNEHGEPHERIEFELAFLDSLDTYVPGHAEHGLAEAKAAAKIVAPNGLIVFDDSPPDGNGGWKGKGRLGIVWLQENGWKVNPISSYQCVLERA